ncbi:DedA family protein [Egbenema bharatensis]|uniref:DedA family protein n=1 Tax=Egbenema bharatensis TaxID=3463334 RepID=UPI003A84C431
MAEWITRTIETLGYLGIALLMFLENLFPPIPSELVMPLAGFTVSQGELSFVPTIAAGVIGTIVGAFPWYYLGKIVGEERIKAWLDRHGRWLTLSSKDLDQSKRWFQRHGKKAVFFCRLVPGVRTLISLPAGLSHMPLPQFVLYSTLGTLGWVMLLTFAGFMLGENYDRVEQYLAPITKLVLLGLVLTLILWIFKRQRDRRGKG